MDRSEGIPLPLDRAAIEDLLPHRAPFLFLDRVTGLVPGESASGHLDITGDEPLLAGHFPGRPVWPGVLTVEALAQLWGACDAAARETPGAGGLGVFAAADKVRFRRMVVPGDRLCLHVSLQRRRGPFTRVRAEARVNGEVAAEGILSFGVAE